MTDSASEGSPDPTTVADPIGAVLLEYASKELHRALAYLGWRGTRLHEGVHQARKSLRRVRATMALGADELGHAAKRIDRQIRRVNRSLSDLRDVHALVETLDRLICKHRSPGTHRLLQRARRAALRHRARVARAEMHADVDFSERRDTLKRISHELPRLPWAHVRPEHVGAALQFSVSRATDACGKALDRGTDEDWHCWRRRVRRLSQQHRALRDATRLRDGTETQDKDLATTLGDAQDYFLLLDHCGKHSPFSVFYRKALATVAGKGLRRRRAQIEAEHRFAPAATLVEAAGAEEVKSGSAPA